MVFYVLYNSCFRISVHRVSSEEPLNKSPAVDGGSFAPAVQFEKLEIHPVFLRFPNFHLVQNLSPSALVDLIRASLICTKEYTFVFINVFSVKIVLFQSPLKACILRHIFLFLELVLEYKVENVFALSLSGILR